MFTIRARIFTVVSLLVLFVLGFSVFLIVDSKKKAGAPGGAEGGAAAWPAGAPAGGGQFGGAGYAQQPSLPANIKVQPPTAEEIERNAARQLAKTFVERYGSYSTHNDYANIKAVEELVTPAFWRTLSKKMDKPQAKEFYGVTAVALSAEVVDWQDGKQAKISVKTRRLEEKGGQRTLSDFNTATVILAKEDGRWLVDKIEAVK